MLLLFLPLNSWSQNYLNIYKEGLRYLKNNQPEKAHLKFEFILSMDKDSYLGLLGESYYYIYKKEWGLSLDVLNRAFIKIPDQSEAYLNRAICKYHLGDFNSGYEDILASLKIDSTNLKTNFYKALILFKYGEYNDALNILNKIEKKLSPEIFSDEIISEFKEIWFHIGNCHLNLKDFSLALYAYNKAVRENPENSDIIYSRAAIHYNNKNWEEALKDYNKVIKLNRKNTTAFYYRGLCNRELFNYNEAIKDFDYLIKIAPKNGLFYHTRGVVYAEKGNHKNAINDYNIALELDPNNADIFLR
jgi:tetratricopeptide (TPR) repeat protein